jgi:hypothetical protein
MAVVLTHRLAMLFDFSRGIHVLTFFFSPVIVIFRPVSSKRQEYVHDGERYHVVSVRLKG